MRRAPGAPRRLTSRVRTKCRRSCAPGPAGL